MTPYIEAKKAEFAKIATLVENPIEDGYGAAIDGSYYQVYRGEFEKFLDTLLDEIESRVLEHMPYEAPDQPNQNAVRAFQHLRTGVETEEVMPSCRGCGAIDGEPCDTRFHADND